MEIPAVSRTSGLETPSGTVTFLFTDIEGSTRLFQHAVATGEEQHGNYTIAWQSYEFYPALFVYRRVVSDTRMMLGLAAYVGGSNVWEIDIAFGG